MPVQALADVSRNRLRGRLKTHSPQIFDCTDNRERRQTTWRPPGRWSWRRSPDV